MRLIKRNFIRIFQRFKLAMTLNILGLSVAFIAFMLLMMQWDYDRTFDRHDPNADKIYRIDRNGTAIICRPLAEMITQQASPHIQAGCLMNMEKEMPFIIDRNGDQVTFKESYISATPDIVDVFHFDMIEGDTKALEERSKFLIPQSIARKWFGDEPAVGKAIYSLQGNSCTVGGVYRDFPDNASMRNAVYRSMGDQNKGVWDNWNYHFYIRTDLADAQAVQEIIDSYMAREATKNANERLNKEMKLTAMQLPSIHTAPPVFYDDTPHTSPQTLLLIFSIAIVILLIAGINYTNFSTAISPLRMKNINTQKVMGATTGELRRALLTESVMVCFFAFILGVLILWNLEKTALSQLIKADIHVWHHPYLLLITGGISIVLGIVAGAYPAYYTTSFAPALVLKGSFGLSPKGRALRKVLMSFQFVASFALIIGSAFMFLQNRYAHTVSLGFDKEALIVSDLDLKTQHDYKVLENQLKRHAEIADVTFSSTVIASSDSYMNWGREYKGEDISYNVLPVSTTFARVMGIHPIEGRDFREDDQHTKYGAYLINERMAKAYNLKAGDMIDSTVVAGIVPDFHYASLRTSISPAAMIVFGSMWVGDNPEYAYSHIYVKTQKGANIADAIDIVRSEMNAISPDYPFNVRFFDDVLNQLYEDEQRLTTLITLFSLLAVFISVVGVFGLVVFDSESRRKEIGIRKVLGSTTSEILLMFNKSYAYILVICFIIAAPLAWYAVDGWLQNFAYKIPIYWWVFPLAFVLVSVVTLLTVTYQNWHAANENPVNSIKNE